MIILDEETLYDGEVYHTVGALGDNEAEYLYFAQPRSSKMKCQYAHDINSGEIELEHDLYVEKTTLEPDETEL